MAGGYGGNPHARRRVAVRKAGAARQAAPDGPEDHGEGIPVMRGAAPGDARTDGARGVLAPTGTPHETRREEGVRPTTLADFTGQEDVKANLAVFIAAAKLRREALDHVLLVGPPGLGKTTMAQIVARELGSTFRSTSGPVIAKAGDLAAQLTALEDRDVLFIDEIHRLPANVEEILYSAMEDRRLDLMIGEGPGARSVKIDLAPFTLIGATTRAGLLSKPLHDRFGIPVRMSFYEAAELALIVTRAAAILGIGIDPDGAAAIATRSRGTPRIANRLLRRVRDFADAERLATIGGEVAETAMARLGVDPLGLDGNDLRYLSTILVNFDGGPVGIETIAAALSEPSDSLEDVVEPYLIQAGMVQRTPRGRLLTRNAVEHLSSAHAIEAPARS